MRTLLKSSNAMRPSPRSHASNVVEGVRQCATRVDRGGRREFECYLNLLMLDFWYRTRPPRSNAAEGYGQRSNAVYRWWHLNACERVSENAALILDCWPLHMAERFVAVYRIVSRYFVHYCIVSIVFPHGHIVPSLRSSLRMTPINHEKFHGNRSARFSEIRNTDRQSRQFYIYIDAYLLLLTKHGVQSNAFICITYCHIELHQFSITCCTITVQLSICRVSFDGFSVKLNCCWVIAWHSITTL